VGMCGDILETLSLFQTECFDFLYLILVTNQNSIAFFRPKTILFGAVYSSNRPQVFMIYRLINHAGCGRRIRKDEDL